MYFTEALDKWEKHFLGRDRTKRDKTTFAGYFSHGENKSESSFLSDFNQLKDYEVNDPNLEDHLHYAISTAVKENSHSKQNAIVMAKSFVDFLNKECGGKISIAYPRVNVSNSLERQMEIVRLLQEEGMTIDELENRLWVDVRTIESDLARLSSTSGDPIEVLGQRLNVEFDRSRGRISFPSKVHPFFLTSNLTQVITMLEGLHEMSKRTGWRKYANIQAAVIWTQLSEPARKRIAEVSDFLGLDLKWYEQLVNHDSHSLFHDEWICSGEDKGDSLLLCYKNSQPCALQYRDENDRDVIVEECRIISYIGESVTIRQGDREMAIPKASIVASRSLSSKH